MDLWAEAPPSEVVLLVMVEAEVVMEVGLLAPSELEANSLFPPSEVLQ